MKRIEKTLTTLGTMLVVFLSSATAEADILDGKKTYNKECAGCHGVDGTPVVPGTPSFIRGEGLKKSDSQLRQTIRYGNRLMPRFEDRLSSDEIFDVLSYIRTLQRY